MTRTVAPRDLGGRLLRNLARTTPELPGNSQIQEIRVRGFSQRTIRIWPWNCLLYSRTVRPGDLAPDHPNVGAADLTLSTVNESDLLAEVELGGLSVINTLNLDQAV